MANADLTAERLREILDYAPDTGVFTWRAGLRHAGRVAGYRNPDGYWRISIAAKKYMAHRLAWLHVNGIDPVHEIDHINGNRADNRITNLRDVTKSVNGQNLRAPKMNNALLGVSWNRKKQKWVASINPPYGTTKYLGIFTSAEEAHAAYLQAKRRLHEGCAI